MAKSSIQSPPGTRDLYPADLLRRRYIEKLWRDTSIRHGFEEIDGPTFEHADLYAVKSGEGILSEVFQVYSGKDEAEVTRIRGGANAPYALRPEFTPTLARMYAAKAGSLAKPTKWFWQQNCFRAEKQQRGRLREFGQWNCDVIGIDSESGGEERADAEIIALVIAMFAGAGLTRRDVKIHIGSRVATQLLASGVGLAQDRVEKLIDLLDHRRKVTEERFLAELQQIGLEKEHLDSFDRAVAKAKAERKDKGIETLPIQEGLAQIFDPLTNYALMQANLSPHNSMSQVFWRLSELTLEDWIELDFEIVRGLAYYTGTVFEVLADGERAIAGGGRYDNLIELFGGPPTPAVGFGMGDVVLSLVLQDRGLLPEGDALMDALSRPSASYRPDVFVISAGQSPEDQQAANAQVRPLVATLRRGIESKAYQDNDTHKPWDANRYDAASGGSPPLHARSSSKSTKNIGKLLQDAVGQKSKLAVIIENAEEVTIKDLRTNQQDTARTRIADLGRVLAQRLA